MNETKEFLLIAIVFTGLIVGIASFISWVAWDINNKMQALETNKNIAKITTILVRNFLRFFFFLVCSVLPRLFSFLFKLVSGIDKIFKLFCSPT